jgi:hypothetical protein
MMFPVPTGSGASCTGTATKRKTPLRKTATWNAVYARLGAAKAGYMALVTAAFCEAAERRFGSRHDAADVAAFVADVRSRSDRLAGEVDPLIAERVISAVFGDNSLGDLSDAAVAGTQIVLLAALVADEHYDDTGLDAFLTSSRRLADQLMRA